MATIHKEIAPGCEIYAINVVVYNESSEVSRIEYFEKAIEWVIANKLDVLKYSHAAFFNDDRVRANNVVKNAVDNSVVNFRLKAAKK